MSEFKPKSFRIDNATAEKFKGISEAIGGNQQEAFSKLIEAFELQQGKGMLVEKKADMEQFEKYARMLTDMYMVSLQDNQNTKEIVRADFESRLKSKDETILSLQGQLKEAEGKRKEAEVARQSQQTEVESLNSTIASQKEKLDTMQKGLDDKEGVIKMQSDRINDMQTKLAEQGSLTDRISELTTENENLKQKLKEQEIERREAELELEKRHTDEVNALKENHHSELEKYQQGYTKLLEQATGLLSALDNNPKEDGSPGDTGDTNQDIQPEQ